MTKKQIYHLVWSFFWVLLGWVLSWTYRSYIYKSDIFDCHLADTIGNWVAVPAAVNFYLAVSKKERPLWQLILLMTVAFAIYEVFLSGTFDWYDMATNILSGALTYLIMGKRKKTVSSEAILK